MPNNALRNDLSAVVRQMSLIIFSPKTIEIMKLKLLKKILIMTKYTIFGIFLQCLFYSFIFAGPGIAQKVSIENIEISVEFDGISIKEAFQKIENLTDFEFAYQKNIIDPDKRLNLKRVRASVADILRKISKEANLRFKRVDETIYVKQKEKHEKALIEEIVNNSAWDKEISGKVTDENGGGLPGVSILVKGTTVGTVTDSEGNYRFSAPDDATILVFTYVGYLSEEIEIEDQTVINISLSPDISTLSEIVVIGYGTQKRANVTGAIATVDASKIQDASSANLSNLLAGRLPGVYIQQGGGKPGFASNIQIRARGSFNDTEPLYVIDGVIRDKFAFDGLDVSEVENISILKDGASAAVYGNKAANGVVLITTKIGKKGQKPQINFSTKFSFDKPLDIPETESALDQARFINDNILGRNNFDQAAAAADGGWYTDDELAYFENNSFDWIEELWEDPTQQQYNLNVSGGTEKTRYFIGGAYYKATGSFDNLDFERYNLRGNFEVDITDNLTAGLNIQNTVRNDEKPFWRWDGDDDLFRDLYKALLFRTSTVPPYIDGKPVGTFVEWHPGEIVNLNSGFNRKKWNDLNATINLTYKIPFVEGLSLGVRYNNFVRNTFIKQFNLPYTLYLFETEGANNHIVSNRQVGTKTRSDGNWLDESYARERSNQLNFNINYDKKFGDHVVGALYVYEQGENFTDFLFARNQDFVSSQIEQLNAGSADDARSIVSGFETEFGRKSHVGRINYSYAGKYLFEAAFRADASTRFAPGERWGFFPSVSAGWRMSDEPFFNVGFVDELKLKASYAEVGSDGGDDVGNFTWLSSFNFGTGALFGDGITLGVNNSGVPSPGITWEVSKTWNAGFEAFFLDNKLSAILDIYSRQNSNILASRILSTPATLGASLPPENYARVDSRGFEIALEYRDQLSSGFKYDIGFNLGWATNEQVIRDEPAGRRAHELRQGTELNLFFGYRAAGILGTQADLDALPEGYTIFGQVPTLGQLNYVDIRGENGEEPDGMITEVDQEFLGRSTPPMNYGIALNGSWKGFYLDLFFQGLAGHKEMVDFRGAQARPVEKNFAFWNDHWTPENIDAAYPRAWNNLAGSPSTFWLRNGSFLRLKNVTLGYNLPGLILNKIGLTNVKVYANAVNLFLLHNNVGFKDPEAESIRSYPLFRTFTFGLNISI